MTFSFSLRCILMISSALQTGYTAFAQYQGPSVSIEDMVAGKSAYIVEEDLEISIYGKEKFSNAYRSFHIKRDFTVKILHSNGLKIFQKMILPENFDPTYKAHASGVKKLGIYYSGYRVNMFKVFVKRSGVKPFSPNVRKKVKYIESFNLDYIYEYGQDVYSIDGLEVGDEVRISYELEIPFQENYSRFASYRIFHHDTIPKLKYRFTLNHHESLDIELYQKNGGNAKRQFVDDRKVKRIWEYENLPGCIKESGSRPYTELPHLTWVLNQYKYLIYNSTEERNIPHYAIIASIKSPDLPEILISVEVGSKSKQYSPFTRTYDKMIEDLPNDFNLIRAIHTNITKDFDYEDDREYYIRNDMRGKRMGEYFENGILRDVSRYDIYFASLVKARLQFFSAYLIDKRSGEISEEYFQPNFDNDFLLAAYFGERIFDIMLPKRNRFGWYYNEIPFYWEDCKARLVHITDYAKYHYPIKESFRSLQTQLTAESDNVRRHNIRALVDLDMDTIHLAGSVFLQGQFSTMCRFSYLHGYKDPTVNKRYNRNLWKEIPLSTKGEISAQSVSTSYPFPSEFEFSFKSGSKVELENGNYIIDLKKWFPHIRPALNENAHRFLTYYPDFLGSDIFQYELQFARPVELLEPVTFGYENEFGYYKFSVHQKSPLTINISSEFHVSNSSLSNDDYDLALDIFKAMVKANNFKLKVK